MSCGTSRFFLPYSATTTTASTTTTNNNNADVVFGDYDNSAVVVLAEVGVVAAMRNIK